jgi:hypothetical protein
MSRATYRQMKRTPTEEKEKKRENKIKWKKKEEARAYKQRSTWEP